MRKKIMKKTSLLFVFTLCASLLTGCGGAKKSMSTASAPAMNSEAPQEYYEKALYDGGSAEGIAYDDYSYDTAAAAAGEVAVEEELGSQVTQNQTQDNAQIELLEEKLVYHCDLEIETLDYQASVTTVKDTISKYGGIIQSESENDDAGGWYYSDYTKTGGTMHNYIQARIPSEHYNSFLDELEGIGKIISKSTSVDNISQRYYDTTAKIEALQIQEKNLLSMMEKCETIEDMIAVEQRLSEVQYELNNLQTDRRYMDMDVSYSYVNINISEVMEYRPGSEPIRRNTFVDRLKNTIRNTGTGFLAFLESILFLIIYLIPYIIIISIIYFIFFRKKVKSLVQGHKIRKEEKRAAKANQDNINQ